MIESTRQKKYARLIQRELGDLFQKDVKHKFGSAFITVTRVEVSPDLSVAKVYLSFLLAKDEQALLNHIESLKSEVRGMLGRRIGKQVRVVPEIIFYHDQGSEHAAKIDEILSKLHIPPSSDDKDKE